MGNMEQPITVRNTLNTHADHAQPNSATTMCIGETLLWEEWFQIVHFKLNSECNKFGLNK